MLAALLVVVVATAVGSMTLQLIALRRQQPAERVVSRPREHRRTRRNGPHDGWLA